MKKRCYNCGHCCPYDAKFEPCWVYGPKVRGCKDWVDDGFSPNGRARTEKKRQVNYVHEGQYDHKGV